MQPPGRRDRSNGGGAADPLRALAERSGLRIGSCVSAAPLRRDRRYAEVLAREFDTATTENALKFGVLSKARGVYDFAPADAIVEFAMAHGMDVRGHVLVWYAQLPDWIVRGRLGASELADVLTNHVTTVVSRYAGRIAVWDVVNEAVSEDGTLRDNVWLRTIGPEYIDLAFRAARQADKGARLFYNDYGIEAGAWHSDAVLELLQRLLTGNTPVDGVGLQLHLDLERLPDLGRLGDSMQRLGALGLDVHVTECDVRMTVHERPTPGQLTTQASVYRDVVQAGVSVPACQALSVWGFTDRHSWIPRFFPGQGAALLFDEEYRPKPAYDAVSAALRTATGRRRQDDASPSPGAPPARPRST
jgi:endo-1,4-beta-xylanase